MFRNPANKNYLEAQTLIGVDYLNGNGITQDYNKAMEWFEKAASENYPPAQEKLGCMYNNGHGVHQNYSQAFKWFQKSANQGYDEGQVSLALMYSDGISIQQDHIKALEWFQKAAKQGNDVAQYNLDLLCKKEGNITQVDNANLSYSKSAVQNSTPSTPLSEKSILTSIAAAFTDTDTDSESGGELTIPFQKFFYDYFHDESGSYPENTGGGVWFTENMDFSEREKFFNKVIKVQQKYDNRFDLYCSDFVIDTTITKNFGAGVFVSAGGYFNLKYLSSEWETITNLESAYYSESDNDLFINDFEISMVSDNARFYGKRLADCINAYLEQNNKQEDEQKAVSNSELVENALSDIDARLADIREKLAYLQDTTEA